MSQHDVMINSNADGTSDAGRNDCHSSEKELVFRKSQKDQRPVWDKSDMHFYYYIKSSGCFGQCNI